VGQAYLVRHSLRGPAGESARLRAHKERALNRNQQGTSIGQKMTQRIMVLGLDGATWRLLNPLMRDGTMPHLKEACAAGASSDWQSTVPPFSAQAWVSLMTGRNPAKHGVTDFWGSGRRPRNERFRQRLLDSG